MFYCTSIFCSNILELRHMNDGTWELHDYSAQVEKMIIQDIQELMKKPQIKTTSKFTPKIIK